MNFFRQALENGGTATLAHDDAGRTLRYDEALAAAEAMHRQGAGRRLWLIPMANDVPTLQTYLACVAGGDAALLVDAKTPSDGLAALVERFDPEVVVDVAGVPVTRRSRRQPLFAELALLLFTSGSTGDSKVARFSARQMGANATAIANYLGLDAAERPYAHLPFHYSFGLSVLHSHLAVGARLELTSRSVIAADYWRRAATDGITSIAGVPFHFEAFLRLRFDRDPPPRLATLTQAGGRLGEQSARKIAEICATHAWSFFVMYGQTEAGPRISYLAPDQVTARPTSVGCPIPGTRIHLVDGAGHDVEKPGTEGELIVEGPSVMLGYARERADLAAGDVNQGRLSTGDLGYRDDAGFYFLTGRKSRQIKLSGNRVNLEAVETTIANTVGEVYAVGEDDRLWIVVRDKQAVAAAREVVRSRFGFPMHNVAFVEVAELPRNSAGKVSYDALLSSLRTERAFN
jgi:long-chain acyl-CoA synthetase